MCAGRFQRQLRSTSQRLVSRISFITSSSGPGFEVHCPRSSSWSLRTAALATVARAAATPLGKKADSAASAFTAGGWT